MVGISSYMLASSSVTRLAIEFLNFIAEEITNYATGQWNLLAENNLAGNVLMENAAMQAVESFSRSILRSDTEAIFALNEEGVVELRTGAVIPTPEEALALLEYGAEGRRGFITIQIDGISRVAYTIPFSPFSWQFFVTEERAVFYGPVEDIFRTSLYILAAVLAAAILLLILTAGYLTKPIEALVTAMRNITESNNLNETVPVFYKDEIGQLSHTFNFMLKALAGAYNQIKRYAFDAVVAQKQEMKIRHVFQLYVPKDVIDEVFVNPEKMLVGNNREVAILFSDIRGFTTISEGLAPDDLVNSLNRYFSTMVNLVMDREGVVDKYIGDAIMAIFGALTTHENDAFSSVMAGLEMIQALTEFNKVQIELGAPEFKIGVGIHIGIVTVGNIGCERKMNYTVIGDAVNVASRLEGLTKKYKEPVLITDSVYEKIAGQLPCRVIDRVAVKGKTQGVPILTARLSLTATETEAWKIHDEAVKAYYNRQFREAFGGFKRVLQLLPQDITALRYAKRCQVYAVNPPPPEWDGVEVMTEK
jgi:class 3 adenylate cyclase/HAMP domain-containing protein